MLETGRGVSEEARARFVVERERRRRELELKGLVWADVDVDAFSALLAARFEEVVPDGCGVSVRNGLVYVAGGGTDIAQMVSDSDVSVEERLVETSERLLEVASESVSEVTSDPWPAVAGMFRGGFPPVHAEVSNGELRMFYGKPEKPLLVLAPIMLSDVLCAPDSAGASDVT